MTADHVTFVLCVERNVVGAQGLLLCESIRRFCEPYRQSRIVAVSPRGLGVNRRTRQRLDALQVDYVERRLNTVCAEYGSANRVFAAAWAEAHAATPWIVVLDSDTLFLDRLELPLEHDVAVRPVDTKGSATEGRDDRLDEYWRRLAAIARVPLEVLPFIRTTDGRSSIRASYNGGLVVARRSSGILQRWADLFSRSVNEGLRPWKGTRLNVRASTGLVGRAASEYWGSNQAALSLAIWGTTSRVAVYDERHNVPLHFLDRHPEIAPRALQPVHVHYHWLFSTHHHRRAVAALHHLGVPADRLSWVASRVPLGHERRRLAHLGSRLRSVGRYAASLRTWSLQRGE